MRYWKRQTPTYFDSSIPLRGLNKLNKRQMVIGKLYPHYKKNSVHAHQTEARPKTARVIAYLFFRNI